MTHLALLFIALTTIGTAEAAPSNAAPHRAQVETNARPSAAAPSRRVAVPTRPVATPRPPPVSARPATRRAPAPKARPVRVTRVRRGGEWVHTAPRRFAAGSLLWIGDRSASVVQISGGRALIEYTNGTRVWIRIG